MWYGKKKVGFFFLQVEKEKRLCFFSCYFFNVSLLPKFHLSLAWILLFSGINKIISSSLIRDITIEFCLSCAFYKFKNLKLEWERQRDAQQLGSLTLQFSAAISTPGDLNLSSYFHVFLHTHAIHIQTHKRWVLS